MALVGALAAPAQASSILDQTLIASGGDVVVTFVSNGAGFTSELYLDGEAGEELGTIFNNWTTAVGTSMALGPFAAGTELIFKLLVLSTGNAFYTGDASRNPDGIVHAVLAENADQVVVGFEDLYGGGDLDYDDLVFAFTNVAATPSDKGGSEGTGEVGAVDEPGTLVMLGSGLSMLVFAMKRRGAS